ncbi:hypothetical protein M0805_008213 [Coniferiporia weirii]|nr:hypothetical protein M0805_008213 [Coniferiporia weirii]
MPQKPNTKAAPFCVAARFVAFIAVLALAAVVPRVSARLEHAHVVREASLTVPTASSSASGSGSESGSAISAGTTVSLVATTTAVVTTSVGPAGTSTFTTEVTTLINPGSSSGSANGSATATTTAFPSLSTYSTCVVECLDLAVSAPNCTSLTDVACYCANSSFSDTLNGCVSSNCTSELTSAENLAQQFCNLETPSVSLSFPASSTSHSASGASNSTSTSTSTVPASSSSGSGTPSSAATGMRPELMGIPVLLAGLVGIVDLFVHRCSPCFKQRPPPPSTATKHARNSLDALTDAPMSYKGKSTTRSWATLPPEVVRLVVTHYLLDVSAAAFLPTVWTHREHWPGRMAFAVVRDADAIEQIMHVSPAWAAALEYHLFWQQAAAVLDPNDHLLQFARQQRLSPFRHFRQNLYQRSCVPCRVNQPASMLGLLAAKRQIITYSLGLLPCCREHRKERFCGICLRDASSDENCIAENEDTEVWPQIEATCRSCRAEWLWRSCTDGQKADGELTNEAEAVGGKALAAEDWEARQSVDAFVEMGEGTIREVIGLCVEKLWLRKNTKIAEMMRLAVATSRMQSRMVENANEAGIGGGYGGMGEAFESEEELSELDDEDEEDPELMSITEESQGVRDLAINDWARTRILDGHWYSPADQWYLLQNQHQSGSPPPSPLSPTSSVTHPFPYTRAQHPVPWSLSQEVVEQPHPDPDIVRVHPPPSLALCSAAFEAYRRQLRAVLLPAMVNIVRKAVMECAVDGTDASVRIARMEIEDVADALREGGTWFNGMDWMGHRQNESENENEKKEDADDSSSSSKSGSRTTSPVLSTSTLQTTPSPPPVVGGKMKGESGNDDSTPTGTMPPPTSIPSHSSRPPPPPPIMTLPIAISPVLESPTQIPSIPFIPESMSEMPAFTIETFKGIWRDACAPLFQCRCRTCERAVLKANIEAGNIVPSQYPPRQEPQVQIQSKDIAPQSQLVEVRLDPASDDDVLPISDESDYEHEQPQRTAGRKRSCEVLDSVDGELLTGDGDSIDAKNRRDRARSPSPPKRPKIGDHEVDTIIVSKPSPSAVRLQKRGSEELEYGVGDIPSAERSYTAEDGSGGQAKRARTSTSPASIPPPLSESESASEPDDYALRKVAMPEHSTSKFYNSGDSSKLDSRDADGHLDLDGHGLIVMDEVSELGDHHLPL